MSRSLLKIILRHLDRASSVEFGEGDLALYSASEVAALEDAGLIARSGSAAHVLCVECDDPHPALVLFLRDANGKRRAFHECANAPEIGRIFVAPEHLQQWTASIASLCNALALLLAAEPSYKKAADGLFQAARLPLGGSRRSVYLAAGCASPRRRQAFESADIRQIVGDAVILTLCAQPPAELFPSAAAVLSLHDVLRLEDGRLLLDKCEIERRIGSASSSTVAGMETKGKAPQNVFRKAGDYWEVVYDGKSIHLADRIGVSYLATLLKQPGVLIPALVLANPAYAQETATLHELAELGIEESDDFSYDFALDSQAVSDLHKRLADLQDRQRRAVAIHRKSEELELQQEIEAIQRYLSAATSKQGAPRRMVDANERARQTVAKAIGSLKKALKTQHPALHEHLSAALTTGAQCSYHPTEKINWIFE